MTADVAKKGIRKKSAVKKSTAKKKSIGKAPARQKDTRKSAVKKNQKSKASPDNGNVLVLNAVLAINDNKKLYVELGKILDAKKQASIDASAVTMVDTAILQLLLAFYKKAQSQNVIVDWVKPSEEFRSRADMLNLTGLLGLQEA